MMSRKSDTGALGVASINSQPGLFALFVMLKRDLVELVVAEIVANIQGILKIAHGAPSASDSRLSVLTIAKRA